jgi:hypothetical protein
MSEAGRRKAAQYDWDIVARRVLTYYEQLIAAQPAMSKIQPSSGKRRIVRVRHLLGLRRGRKASTSAQPSREVTSP